MDIAECGHLKNLHFSNKNRREFLILPNYLKSSPLSVIIPFGDLAL